MSGDERDYLWKHFEFNAEQRLKAFNFFVVFFGFANGGIFAALPANARVFTRDHKSGKLIRYTTGLRTLFVIQFLCGLGAIDYGLRRWAC